MVAFFVIHCTARGLRSIVLTRGELFVGRPEGRVHAARRHPGGGQSPLPNRWYFWVKDLMSRIGYEVFQPKRIHCAAPFVFCCAICYILGNY